MANSLKASRSPFCFVVMPADDQKLVLLLQVKEHSFVLIRLQNFLAFVIMFSLS